MGLARRDRGARRKAMSVHIVDDEQRRDRPQHPCALWVPGGEGASAALALLAPDRSTISLAFSRP